MIPDGMIAHGLPALGEWERIAYEPGAEEPLRVDALRMVVGMQLVGLDGDDEYVIDDARATDDELPWWAWLNVRDGWLNLGRHETAADAYAACCRVALALNYARRKERRLIDPPATGRSDTKSRRCRQGEGVGKPTDLIGRCRANLHPRPSPDSLPAPWPQKG